MKFSYPTSETKVFAVSFIFPNDRMITSKKKVLDDHEKLQYLELQRAREKIIQQLSSLSERNRNQNADDISFTRSVSTLGSVDFKQPVLIQKMMSKSSDINKTGLNSSQSISRRRDESSKQTVKKANYIERLAIRRNSAKSGVDMIPVLSITGDYALGFENRVAIARTRGAETRTAIRLPVFKLPSIDPTDAALAASLTYPGASQHTKRYAVSDPWSRFIPYKTFHGMRKALLRLVQLLQQQLLQNEAHLLGLFRVRLFKQYFNLIFLSEQWR